jgi:Kef-type K+ transport system membrane component KefB
VQALTTILVDLFILFTAARLAGIVAVRLGQPAVIGELLAGIVIGPHALGLVGHPGAGMLELFGGDRAAAAHALELTHETVAELGVVVLLFSVGLETRATDILRVGARAGLVGVLGIVVPFVLGFALMAATGHPRIESAFVATALVATSVGITARVLQELGVLRGREARIILGAAVIDDVLGLILLAVVSSAAGTGASALEIVLIAVQAIAFVGFVAWAGTHATRRYTAQLARIDHTVTPLNVALIVMLGLAALAGVIGLAGIIGAFLAGMVLAESREQLELEHALRPIYDFLVPFFFVVTGTRVDLSAFGDGPIVALAAVVTLVAVVGKLLGAMLATVGMSRRTAVIVGVGMVPRGEVGLIVAGIGLSLGIIPGDIFAVVVFMSIVTTLLVPPVLNAVYRRSPEIGAASVITRHPADEMALAEADDDRVGVPAAESAGPATPQPAPPRPPDRA